jgi:ubiquinone/menaquinone biosynthesis C-methylase UbiE
MAQARRSAAAEGLTVVFEEGDAEALPYENATFDAVVSLIGAMFAPRPALVAAELTRVCRPLIEAPSVTTTAGTPPKTIAEYVGRRNTGDSAPALLT